MADAFHYLSDMEEDINAVSDLSAVLCRLYERGQDDLTPAEAAGMLRVLTVQAEHAQSLLLKWSTAHEALAIERRHANG